MLQDLVKFADWCYVFKALALCFAVITHPTQLVPRVLVLWPAVVRSISLERLPDRFVDALYACTALLPHCDNIPSYRARTTRYVT